MTDAMAVTAIRLLIALARYLVRGAKEGYGTVEEAADRAEQACNERARIP